MLNSVSLIGRLCADPELRETNGGTKVTSFTLAVDRNFVNKEGTREADFVDVTVWHNTAEFVCKNFKKGSAIAVHGTLRTRNYDDKDGNRRKAVEVEADDISFCGPRPKKEEE